MERMERDAGARMVLAGAQRCCHHPGRAAPRARAHCRFTAASGRRWSWRRRRGWRGTRRSARRMAGGRRTMCPGAGLGPRHTCVYGCCVHQLWCPRKTACLSSRSANRPFPPLARARKTRDQEIRALTSRLAQAARQLSESGGASEARRKAEAAEARAAEAEAALEAAASQVRAAGRGRAGAPRGAGLPLNAACLGHGAHSLARLCAAAMLPATHCWGWRGRRPSETPCMTPLVFGVALRRPASCVRRLRGW